LGVRNPRRKDGRLLKAKVSVAQVAAAMPHRRTVGGSVDQRAECELGRMLLRGEIDEEGCRAGEIYRLDWRRYVTSISAPRDLGKVVAGRPRCNDCAVTDREFVCLCELRKRHWYEVVLALADTGATGFVDEVVLWDRPIEQAKVWILKVGLSCLARHYGLTKTANRRSNNRPSRVARPVVP
jgi:hypothetical protein